MSTFTKIAITSSVFSEHMYMLCPLLEAKFHKLFRSNKTILIRQLEKLKIYIY